MKKEINNEVTEMQESNGVLVVNRNDLAPNQIESLTDMTHSFYSSIADDGTRKSKVAIYNAINKSDKKLDDVKGVVLHIKDVVAHSVNILDENTGELIECTRIVLIDKDGIGYESISLGIYSSLQKLFGIVGQPTWEEPLTMKVVEQKTRKGYKTMTLELV